MPHSLFFPERLWYTSLFFTLLPTYLLLSRGSRGGYPLAALGSEDWCNPSHGGVFSDGRPSVHGVPRTKGVDTPLLAQHGGRGTDCALTGLAPRAQALPGNWLHGTGGDLSAERILKYKPLSQRIRRREEEKKERKQTNPNEGWGRRTGSQPARAGFWKDDQGNR